MIGRLLCPVSVFLFATLTIGCKSTANQGLTDRVVSEAASTTMVQAQPEQPLGLEPPFVLPQLPPTAIPPDANIHLHVPHAIPNPNPNLKILAVTPEPGIDFKMAHLTPDPRIDYKMLIVPEQEHSPHAIRNLDALPTPEFRPLPKTPSLPQKHKYQQQGDQK